MRYLLLLLLIGSGATSLVYETLWIRVLSLGVGSTSASMSIVLSIFFLGLAGGSFLSGRFSGRFKNPVLVYGLIEGAIGLYCAGLIYPLIHFHQLLSLLPNAFSFLGIVSKFTLVALLLLPPTLGMGATLPLLIRSFAFHGKTTSQSVSLLYGLNTLGGVVGALATSFILIPKWGVLLSNHSVVVTNILILISSILVSRRMKEADAPPGPSGVSTTPCHLGVWERAMLTSCGICGFVSIACEVVWNKYLAIFFGTNIYGLGIILAIYLLGMALGSLLLSIFTGRIRDPKTLFIILLSFSLLFIYAASHFLNLAPPASQLVSYFLGQGVSLLLIKSVLTSIILFLPTLAFGALFPLSISLLTKDNANTPYLLGLGYAVNTVGAILGSYFAGIVLIPTIGSSHTMMLALFLKGGLILTLAWFTLERGRAKALAVVGVFGVMLFAVSQDVLRFENIIKSAYQQRHAVAASVASVLAPFSAEQEEFKLIVEGETGIISLSHDKNDGENFRQYLRLKTSGLNESIYDQKNLTRLPKYEALLGLLPYVLIPSPKNAFVVGYGGGYTVDFLTSVALERVHVVEIEKGILTAANYVHASQNPILKRKSLDLKIEDARFILSTRSGAPYDIIVSQPSHSWLSGAANLFTREFFEIVKLNLTQRGVFSQWLNLYNMDVTTLKSILRTFYDVFPHGAAFTNANDEEMIMVGSQASIRFDIPEVERLTKDPKFRSALSEVPFHSLHDFLSNYSLTRTRILALTRDASLNTDINAFAEVNQSRLFYSDKSSLVTPQDFLSRHFFADYDEILNRDVTGDEDFLYKMSLALKDSSKYDKFHVVFNHYERVSSGKKDRYWKLGYLCLQAQRYDSAYLYLRQALALSANVDVLNLVLSSLVDMEKHKEVIEYTSRFPRLRDRITECYLAYAYLQRGQMGLAKNLFTKLTRDVGGYTKACGDFYNKIVGDYYHSINEHKTAIPFYEAYYQAFSHDVPQLKRMIISYLKVNDLENFNSFSSYLTTAEGKQVEQLKSLISFYRKNNLDTDANVLEEKIKRVRN